MKTTRIVIERERRVAYCYNCMNISDTWKCTDRALTQGWNRGGKVAKVASVDDCILPKFAGRTGKVLGLYTYWYNSNNNDTSISLTYTLPTGLGHRSQTMEKESGHRVWRSRRVPDLLQYSACVFRLTAQVRFDLPWIFSIWFDSSRADLRMYIFVCMSADFLARPAATSSTPDVSTSGSTPAIRTHARCASRGFKRQVGEKCSV